MDSSADNQKLIIDKLLNTYSIDAIISSFHSIDEKIIAIIRFSSEDFIHLNSIFRKYHQEINLLSTNAFRLFTGFNEELNLQHAAVVGRSTDILKDSLAGFESQIDFSRTIHEQILQKLEQIFIPVNNFYQDLNTLKLLATSLKLDPVTHGRHGEVINKNIADIFTSYPNFIENLRKLKKFVSNSSIAIDSCKKNYLDSAHHILAFCKSICDTILTKQKQGREFKATLEEILKQTRASTSVILTNLQYQDIVKQKIEHVKQIHNEIIRKLSVLVDQTGQPDYALTRAKLFLQIKEIALLQSAQMVYANREYQKAVEIITAEFLHLSDRMDEINAMLLGFSTPDTALNGNNFDADLNIRREVNLYNEIDAINSIFRLQTEGIIQRITNFSFSFRLIYKTCMDFRQAINLIRQQRIQSGDESASIIEQMSEVAEELVKTITGVKSGLDENTECINLLHKRYNENYLGGNFESIQKQEVKNLSNAFRELNYLNREILQFFSTKMKAISLSSELRESIESVRYYDHFEKEIAYIINCLNEISDKMKAGDALIMEEGKEEINTLRKRYTMESEHRIHDFVVKNKGKGSIEIFNDERQSTDNEDEGTLEIF